MILERMGSTSMLQRAGTVVRRDSALESGDHMDAHEFERRWDALPELRRAELIEGVVYVPSPVTSDHSEPHMDVVTWLGVYRAATPGVRGGAESTVRLDLENRPQPDVLLYVPAELGGQVRISEDRYHTGGPELVVEVARSSLSIDLHDKKVVYARHGVREYVIWRVDDERIDWLRLEGGDYRAIRKSRDGFLKSRIFPGLWLDEAALARHDLARLLEVLRLGLASRDHERFVNRLRRLAGGTRRRGR